MTTTLSRRAFALSAAATALLPAGVHAQSAYPDKPIRVVVPFGPGGIADVTMRVVGEKLGALLGQPIVVVNTPGAGGVLAAKSVLSAPADGYTLALFTNGTAISTALAKEPPFDPETQFVPVSSLGFFDFVLVTKADAPYKSLADFVAAAKAAPGTLNIGTINVGSTQNLSAVLLKSLTGIDCAIVPFKTTPDVLTATLRGDVHLAIDGYSAAKSLIEDRQLKLLATSGPKRSPSTPNAATAIESGVKDFDVTSWNAVYAPAGTPAPVIAALSEKLAAALADPGVRAKLMELGIEASWSRPEVIAARLKADIAKWSAVIDAAGIVRK